MYLHNFYKLWNSNRLILIASDQQTNISNLDLIFLLQSVISIKITHLNFNSDTS